MAAALTTAVGAAYLASVWWGGVYYEAARGAGEVSVSVSYGEFCVFANAKEQGSRRGFFVARNPPFVAWLPRVNFWEGCWRVGVPLWAPFLMVAIPAHFLIVGTKKRLPGE